MGGGQIVFGPAGLAVIGLYLLSMLLIGWIGYRKKQDGSMADFYLAGRSMGLFVLFLTLYATQYSGNTLFGYTGKTYRIGFEWTVSILFMFSIIVGYMLFAPRLVPLARARGFITPGDYIRYRFGSKRLTLACTALMIYALANYALAQLKAMGAAVEGITNGAVPASYGIIALAIIMVVYETLGGMRSVAWTDAIQGIVLLAGFLLLVFIIPQLGGGLTEVVEKVSQLDPPKVQVPTLEGCNTWVSYILLLGCGAAIYPQAIQRLYAGRSLGALKRSMAIMAFMPLTTTLVALICGLVGFVVLPGLEKGATDQVLARLLALVMQDSLWGYWLVVAVFAAALAALMSTADSALLSIASMVTRDVYQGHIRPNSSEAELALVGKLCSWIVVIVLVAVAIATDKTLIRLLELKFEVLIQVAPCFFLGLYWKRLGTGTVWAGLGAGLVLGLGLTFGGHAKVYGFHAGVLGLALNMAVCAVGAWRWPTTR